MYSLGGIDDALREPVDSVHAYNPDIDSWVDGPTLPMAMTGMAAAEHLGCIFVCAGWLGEDAPPTPIPGCTPSCSAMTSRLGAGTRAVCQWQRPGLSMVWPPCTGRSGRWVDKIRVTAPWPLWRFTAPGSTPGGRVCRCPSRGVTVPVRWSSASRYLGKPGVISAFGQVAGRGEKQQPPPPQSAPPAPGRRRSSSRASDTASR